MYYNNSLEEHYKVHKIIEVISQLYYFLYMQRKIVNYVNKCNLCHKIKILRHKSYREMKIALVLDWF